MKTVYAGVMNWKTTIVGMVLAVLLLIQEQTKNGIQWDDPQLWIAVLIAALGFIARDADKNAKDSGVLP